MKVGDKVKCVGEKQRYTIQARDDRFIIMTKPFNARKTYLYSIVDLERGIRGRDNLIFGSFEPYNTKAGAEENLKALQRGAKVNVNLDDLVEEDDNWTMEVSYRHYKKLEPEEIKQLGDSPKGEK